MTEIAIAAATAADLPALQALRRQLWPDADDLPALDRAESVTLLARETAGPAIGFAEATTRHDYVNGCDGSPVAFLEGLFVAPAWRRQGIARALLEAVAGWARARGLGEIASDALLANEPAYAAHRACGFTETERVVYFRREV